MNLYKSFHFRIHLFGCIEIAIVFYFNVGRNNIFNITVFLLFIKKIYLFNFQIILNINFWKRKCFIKYFLIKSLSFSQF